MSAKPVKNWTAQEVRQAFLDFFKSVGHRVVPSAPIVIKGDPTLMFTNAGMNQFKDYFLGNSKAVDTRVTDTQKCLRVSGKHNDLEEVGHDTYHHTMFEMLGNWSFGDYFKKEAIDWSWQLLTEVYGLSKDRLYVTVFEGDQSDGQARDHESYEQWLKWVDEKNILNGNRKDNFWEMGASGPCGPSSEIHIDLRSDDERQKLAGQSLVNNDHPLVVEIWNLVFIEFNRKADGSLENLPEKHVDTGMGFERLCMALQGVQSNYDTDVFKPLITRIEELTGTIYGKNEPVDIAIRVVADHVRAVAFAIADGQLPSNTGAGYVIRRILRRAIRYAFSYLDKKEAFIFELVDILSQTMGSFFPEIKDQRDLVANVIREEEQGFLRTLDQGLSRIDQMIVETTGKEVAGKLVFELHDTFGFPPDLTGLILGEQGYHYNQGAYDVEMMAQKERARGASKIDTDDWVVLAQDDHEEFVGYDRLETEVRITRYRKVVVGKKEQYQLVFNLTPFYPEGGGQVGDKGVISNDNEEIAIYDAKREHGIIMHFASKLPKNPGANFMAKVNVELRQRTALNHSATHLLHQALREVLGEHVQQKGSLVNPEHLRFDFSHFARLTEEEERKIEARVNELIRSSNKLEEFRNIPMSEAIEQGALALFGEKYGDTVRMIRFGNSAELCGGIHVESTGNIGLFKILSESAVASGIRRLEALTGDQALEYVEQELSAYQSLKTELKHPKDPIAAVQAQRHEIHDLQKKLDELLLNQAREEKKRWLAEAEDLGDHKLIISKTSLDSRFVKDIIFQLKSEHTAAIVIGVDQGDKAQLAIAFSDSLISSKDWHAGKMVKELAKEISGGGGGQPAFATAGGKNSSGLDKALQLAKETLK